MKNLVPMTLSVLGGCTSLVPATMLQLMALSPLEADPADLAFRVSLPEGLQVIPGSAGVRFQAENSGQGWHLDHVYPIATTPGPTALMAIPQEHHDAVRETQALLRSWEFADGEGTSGSISVDLGFCRTAIAPQDDAVVTVDVQTQSEGAFLPLSRDAPLHDVMARAAPGGLPRCAAG